MSIPNHKSKLVRTKFLDVCKVHLEALKFKGDKFGIVIAPFEALSFNVSAIPDSDRQRSLEQVMDQIFIATRHLIDNNDWLRQNFEFVMLPPNYLVRGKQDIQVA
jgi:hypothetical protein